VLPLELATFNHYFSEPYYIRYMPELGELEAYTDINNLLKKGIAYHHAGMLPILREYVELCFQARLVKVHAWGGGTYFTHEN